MIGIDLGKKSDYSTLIQLTGNEVVTCHRWPLETPYRQVLAEAKRYPGPAAFDASGVGGAIVELWPSALPVVITAGRKGPALGEDNIMRVSKQYLCQLVQRRLTTLKVTAAGGPVLRDELVHFQFGTLAAAPGYHDDCIMALAICLLLEEVI